MNLLYLHLHISMVLLIYNSKASLSLLSFIILLYFKALCTGISASLPNPDANWEIAWSCDLAAILVSCSFITYLLTLSWRRFLSYRNQSIDLHSKWLRFLFISFVSVASTTLFLRIKTTLGFKFWLITSLSKFSFPLRW